MSEFDSYDSYKLQWLIDNKYSLSKLILAVSKFADEYDGDDKDKLSFCDFFSMWEFEHEMEGDLYTDYDCWLYCKPSSGVEGMSVSDFIR